ncbi:MAG: lipoyl(octanoyl) transferase LipB [Myxococcota bacterium]
MNVHWLGRRPYVEVHELQRAWVAERARDAIDDRIVLVEHPAVITVGRGRGARDDVTETAVEIVEVERGGQSTLHAPGQLVAYPIVKLEGPDRDLHRHLRRLEDAVIDVLALHGVRGQRDDRNTGVWLPAEPLPLKVCSVGIACRKWVTWHGLALNLHTDLERFGELRPCGFSADIMTRVADHLDRCPPLVDWVAPLASALARRLERPWDGAILD